MSFWTNPGQSLSNFDPGPGLGNFFSSVDPGPALGKTFASLDPGPMIGNLGVQIDKGVQDNIPGGWATIGALAATVATMGAASGMLAADLAVESTVIMEDGTVLTTFVDGTTAATTLDGATTLTAASGEPLGLLNTSVSAIPTADVTTGATLTDSATAINSGTATAASGGSSTGALGVATGDTGAVGAGAANSGLSASSIGQSALTGAGKGALVGGLKAAATGQDPLTGALTGAATGAVGGSLGSVGTQLTGSNIIGGVAGGVGGGATGAAINNKDIGTGALIGGLSGGTTAGINSITDSNLGSTIAPLTGATIGSLVNTGSLPSFLSGLSGSSSTPTASGSTPTTNTASADTTNSNTLGGVALPVAKTIKGSQISIPQTTYASESSVPVYQPTYNPQSLSEIQNAKDGGIIHMASGGEFPRAQGLLHGGTANYFQGVSPLSHAPTSLLRLADGGDVQSDDIAQHNPTFFSEGGLDSLDNTYVQGDGDGTSDDVAAMLADGEFVIPADCVSKLGNGSSNAGAKVLDEFLATIREHKQKHDPKQLPPDSKGPLGYLLKAKQKAKA